MRALKQGYLDVVFVVLIWSGFVLVSRIGGKSTLLSFDVVALRFGTAAMLMLPYWLLKNKVNLLQWKLVALSLIGGIAYCTLVYYAFRFAPAAHAGILLPGLLPFEAAIFSWLILKEAPSKWRMAGLASIALGVVALTFDMQNGGENVLLGDLSFVAAGSCWALYTVLVRKWQIAPLDATVGLSIVSAAIYLPVYILFLPKHMDIAPWGTILFQAFYQGVMAMIVAMIFYMRAMKQLGPSTIGLFMALVPVIAGIIAVPLIGEPLTTAIIIGLGCVSLGAWLGSRG